MAAKPVGKPGAATTAGPRKPALGEGSANALAALQHHLDGHQERLDGHDAAIADHHDRISALEKAAAPDADGGNDAGMKGS